MEKINFKFILQHLIGAVLIIGAFENLGLLYNLDLIKSLNDFGYENGLKTYSEINGINQGEAMSHFRLSTHLINLIGLVICTILSVFVAKKRSISLINTGVSFLLSYLYIIIGFSNIFQFPDMFKRVDLSLIAATASLSILGTIIIFTKWKKHEVAG